MPSMDRIRSRFPALAREVNGHPVAYFDGPGGTQVPESVADAVRGYLLERNANDGWNYATSRETDEVLHAGRAAMADLLGGRPEEIAFGQNMTTLTLRVSRALGLRMEAGDEVVVTELDHHANVDPWKALARERGVTVKVARMDPGSGTLDMEDLEAQLGPRTRVLAIGAASNALGTITDVAAAAARARAVGALVYVDAVHYAPHSLPDAAALDADFLVVSPYKFYGPHLGALWGRTALLEELDLPRVESAPAGAPERVETGTLSFEAIAGATAAVAFLASLADDDATGGAGPLPDARDRRRRLARSFDALHHRGDTLFRRLWDGMNGIDGVTTFGVEPGGARTPTLGFAIEGVDPRDAAGDLAEKALFLSHGDFYATTVIRRLGYGGRGILRAGCAAYTTEAEVDRLVEGVGELAGRGKASLAGARRLP
ncbi:MAG TPA: cysteine desulfurase-like protein [Longimicrobiales bacterium]|nr:cysteine desulfurase-like protein [Longimicrobiales bacterium]